MNRVVLLTCCLLICHFCHAEFDSLISVIKSADNETTKIKAQISLLDAYFDRGYNQEAIKLGTELLATPEVDRTPEYKAKIANRLGTVYTNIGGKDNEALKYLTIALNIYIDQEDKYGQGIIYNNLGNIYRDLAYDSKAMDYYLKSLEICREINDIEGEGYVLKNIGILYELQDWYEKALEYHQQALKIRESYGSDYQIVSSMLNVAICYNGLREYEKALDVLNKAYDMALKNNSELIDEIEHEKGIAYFNLNQPEKAQPYYQKAIEQAIKSKKYKVVITTLEDLIRLNLTTNDFEEMKINLHKMKSVIDSIDNVRGKINYELLSYKLDSAQNNELAALRHYQRMSQLNDSVYEVSNREDLIQQRSALELLQTENELKIERTSQMYKDKIYLYSVIFLIITILGMAYTVYAKYRSNKELNRQKIEISAKNTELKKLNDQLNDTIEELKSANETIETQNSLISKHNEKLEAQVLERTEKVVAYSKKLEQYAFHTAHNLRAPVARLLGLSHLFTVTPSEKEKVELIDKIEEATNEIDKVIHEISVILDETSIFKESIRN